MFYFFQVHCYQLVFNNSAIAFYQNAITSKTCVITELPKIVQEDELEESSASTMEMAESKDRTDTNHQKETDHEDYEEENLM